VLEDTNAAIFERGVEILRNQAATEEACRHLMAAELQRLPELNTQRQDEAAAH
jgi:hypothetical protein